MKTLPPPGPPVRLWTAGLAVVAALALFGTLHEAVQASIRQHIERFNGSLTSKKLIGFDVDPQPEKLVGVALPQQAFSDPGLLPVYGSSELTQQQANRADEFFGSHPTGFGAFLMGNPGETCLIIANRLAAAGPEARGKKAVVFLSPGWFLAPGLDPRGFGVNFSPLQGGIFAFESRLSPELKRDLAARLLDYPEVIRQSPLLAAALDSLAGRATAEEALLAAATPFAGTQNRVQREMDYFWVGLDGWLLHPSAGRAVAGETGPIDWAKRLTEADAAYARQPAMTTYSTGPGTSFDDNLRQRFRDPKHPEVTPDQNFERACLASKEWTDFQLLLRTAREMKIHLLVICQPLNAKFSQLQGLTARSGKLFYDRLREAAGPFKARLVTFPDGELDPHFYRDCVHPSAKAWIAYDAALDAFYHEPVTVESL